MLTQPLSIGHLDDAPRIAWPQDSSVEPHAGVPGSPESLLTEDARNVIAITLGDEPGNHATLKQRLQTLTQLAALVPRTTRPEQAAALAVETLARHTAEVRYACVYLAEAGGQLRYVCATPGAPPRADWPLTRAAAADVPIVLGAPSAVLVPLRTTGEEPILGVLVLGLARGCAANQDLLGFFAEVGQQVATILTIAVIHAHAKKQMQVLSLQDHALQTFFVIGLVARAALAELAPDQVGDNVATALAQIIEVATTGREHLRQAIFALRYTEVAPSGVIDALKTLASNFQQRTGIDAEVLVTGAPRNLPAEVVEMLHHAAAESLGNIEQHAEASAVVLSLHLTRTSVTLSVQDDGVGIANTALERIASGAAQFGLRGVGDRVRGLGGSFTAKPSRDGGFLVRTRLPLKPSPGQQAAAPQ
jgi:hypothetical protein